MYYIDIETAPKTRCCGSHSFVKRFNKDIVERQSETVDHDYRDAINHVWDNNAALHAEFGKIVCVCIGGMSGGLLKIKSLCAFDEKLILEKLYEILESTNKGGIELCAHNGKEFDFPFLFRRYLINGLNVPSVLNTIGLKPWDTDLYDTMEIWSGTQWKHKCSLELLCECLGIESPKSDMTGADVGPLFYEAVEGNAMEQTQFITKLVNYCAGDVVATAKCHRAMTGLAQPLQIEII